jgi:L-ascorbate metabolism protein UlaG (beta-lactamase superfamily)
MLPDGSNGGNPGGFVIESAEGNFYFSGDTALTWDMKLIGEIAPLSWAALCIGDNFTMGPRDAARAAEFVGVKKVLGIHYDTFPPIAIDHDAARQQFADQGRELILATIGEPIDL